MAGISDLADASAVRLVTGAYQMTPTDSAIFATAGSAYTVTLLPATQVGAGAQVIVAKDATNNLITVSGGGTNIDSAATYASLTGASFKSVTLVSNGTIWRIVAQV